MLALSRSLGRPPAYAGLLEIGHAPDPQAGKPLSFRERGFSFMPVRQAHLDFLGFVYGHGDPPPHHMVEGYTMVDDRYLPLGMALVHLEPATMPDGSPGVRPMMYAHFGPWLRVYPKDILRQMHVMADDLRRRGLKVVYAYAAREIEGSTTLLQWARAELIDETYDLGPLYRIDLDTCPI